MGIMDGDQGLGSGAVMGISVGNHGWISGKGSGMGLRDGDHGYG